MATNKIESIADTLVNVSYKIKKGEMLVITSDYNESNLALCDTVYDKAREAGAEALIIRTAPAESHGKVADKVIPFKAFTALMRTADCWLDTGTMGWLYSNAFETVMRENPRIRYYLISSIPVDHLYNMIVLPPEIGELADTLCDMLTNTKKVHVTNAHGTDVEFGITPDYPVQRHIGEADKPGFVTPPAMVNIIPKDDTLTGKIVVNCFYGDPWGITDDITLHCEKGTIVDVTSKNPEDAIRLKAWNASWNDPNIYRTAHMNFGLLPGVREFLNTGVLNDGISNERMWGCMNWGFGDVSKTHKPPHGQPCKSHSDGITPKISAWLDGVQIMDHGVFIYGELKRLADIILAKVAAGEAKA